MERVLTDLLKRLLVFLLWRAGSRAGVDWRRVGRRYHLHPGHSSQGGTCQLMASDYCR